MEKKTRDDTFCQLYCAACIKYKEEKKPTQNPKTQNM